MPEQKRSHHKKRDIVKDNIKDQMSGSPKKPELPLGLKPTALESASRDLILAHIAVDEAKETVKKKTITIIAALKEAHRTSVNVEGYSISYDITAPTEKVTVKKFETN
jgi:hypothetical protein